MQLSTALTLAKEAMDELRPYCDRVSIAGGIRRGKQEPHDIELVVVPKIGPMQQGVDVFGNPILQDEDMLFQTFSTSLPLYDSRRPEWDKYPLQGGEPDKAGKSPPMGPKYYRLKYKGEKLDVFAVTKPAQWGVVFTLRTGSGDFNKWLVVQGWGDGLYFDEGRIVRRTLPNGVPFVRGSTTKNDSEDFSTIGYTKLSDLITAEISTPEESDVFKILKLKFIHPEERYIDEKGHAYWLRNGLGSIRL